MTSETAHRISNLEILVEEHSMVKTLDVLMPRIAPGIPAQIRTFDGKSNLLKRLPQRLAGYSHWAGGAELGIIVLVDQDDDDCRQLKQQLCSLLPDGAQLGVFSALDPGHGRVRNRIVCRELESWFFGDIAALRKAYPRIPQALGSKARYRNVDAISQTWESLERVLMQNGYHQGGMPKTSVAAAVAEHMSVEENTSMSFQHFKDGVRAMVGGAG